MTYHQRMGMQFIRLSRPVRGKDGIVRNYPLTLSVDVVDHCLCGRYYYIATKADVVFKRLRIVFSDLQDTVHWQFCPELCVFNRGFGSSEVFAQTIMLLEEERNQCGCCVSH